MVIVGVLALLSTSLWGTIKRRAEGATCAHSLRQLGMATNLYLGEHDNEFPRYREATPEGVLWYFGLETGGGGEGERSLDATKSPLYPYLRSVGKVEVCPSFQYKSALWKPKFKGASWGYGYNWRLGGAFAGPPLSITKVEDAARTILFGDCAQVNTFQAPASPDKPMLEEFYIINESFPTIHFRHGSRANFVFVDGHVEGLPMHPGTQDGKMKAEVVGRIAPVGSTLYLK